MEVSSHNRRLLFLSVLILCAVGVPALAGVASTLKIGTRKQLFIDDFLIQSVRHARQVMNPAVKHPDNPVLRRDRPWEGNFLNVGYVVYDEEDGLFKMWYSSRQITARPVERPLKRGERMIRAAEYEETDSRRCYAVSRDGANWEKPDLGLVTLQGSTRNNILPAEPRVGYLILDPREEDPSRRYKGFVRRGTTSTPGMQLDLYTSPDGLKWTAYEGNPVLDTSPRVGRWGPTSLMGWDPIRKKYAVHMESCAHSRCPRGIRVIGRAESPDMIQWTGAETIVVPDEKDYPDTQFYGMSVAAYEDYYIGMLRIFRTNSLHISPELVWSRDGIHYRRPYREPAFIALGANGSFDDGCVYARPPLAHEDRILIYYTGTNWVHGVLDLLREENPATAIGLATLPADGFVSVDAGPAEPSYPVEGHPLRQGELVTRAFSFQGDALQVTFQASEKGSAGVAEETEVRVELLDGQHVPLAGFIAGQADPLEKSGTHRVSWGGRSQVGKLEGQAIRIRFLFQNAKLYSFQFR